MVALPRFLAGARRLPTIATHNAAPLSPAAWDAAVRQLGGTAPQSWRWGELFRRNGFGVERVLVERSAGTGLAQVVFRRQGAFTVAHIPRGPLVRGDGPAVTHALFAAVDAACAYHHAVCLTVEPDTPLPLTGTYKTAGFVRGSSQWYPSRTIKVPLGDDAMLLAQMRPTTRRRVRQGEAAGVTVARVAPTAEAQATFYALLAETAERNAFDIGSPDYYAVFLDAMGEDAALFFASLNGEEVATAIVTRFGPEAIYMFGASSTEGRVPASPPACNWRRCAGAGSRAAPPTTCGASRPRTPTPRKAIAPAHGAAIGGDCTASNAGSAAR